MLQGLCMFGADEKLVLFNPRFAEIYGLPAEKIKPGMTSRQLMELASSTIQLADTDAEGTLALQRQFIRENTGGTLTEHLTDGRSIAISHRPMPGGGFVVTFEDISERLLAEARIKHQAHYDALTDLPNRVTFYERMETILTRLRRSESIAVLSLDLDHFKNVNDMLGHPIGDRLLQSAADRMRSCIRGEDIVARLGGDEFGIVQVPTEQPMDVTVLAARLIDVVGAPYELDGCQVTVGISVGIALAPPDGTEPDILMKNADLALYRAKADGGGVYRFFEIEMDARMQARRVLELDLRNAIANGEFEVFYQPIIDVKTTQITGCEALVRWNHPVRGMIGPLEFIPVAEEIGLIVPLGEWVLRQACAEAARWPKHISVAVNLSPAQFKNRNLVQTVVSALAASGLPADRLELEITELVLIQETEGAFAVLHQLRELGIRIAMDDFGTGYSSLGYLRSFPFNKI
ncbi:MAG: putative bifunctional diguanylate cyclase/phosphodiesterase, partial [Chthoniobacterales bacterium]